MNTAAWQPSKTRPEREHRINQGKHLADRECGSKVMGSRKRAAGYFKLSKRLIIVAVAITLRRRDVAIFAVVVFGDCRRRFLGLAVVLLGKLAVFAGSTHVISSGRVDKRFA
jgi:hypothetical protein